MFAEEARRLIIVDDVDDFADDPNPLEKRLGGPALNDFRPRS
jgi:hypothetical protein